MRGEFEAVSKHFGLGSYLHLISLLLELGAKAPVRASVNYVCDTFEKHKEKIKIFTLEFCNSYPSNHYLSWQQWYTSMKDMYISHRPLLTL